jgi:hypothetical protein
LSLKEQRHHHINGITPYNTNNTDTITLNSKLNGNTDILQSYELCDMIYEELNNKYNTYDKSTIESTFQNTHISTPHTTHHNIHNIGTNYNSTDIYEYDNKNDDTNTTNMNQNNVNNNNNDDDDSNTREEDFIRCFAYVCEYTANGIHGYVQRITTIPNYLAANR